MNKEVNLTRLHLMLIVIMSMLIGIELAMIAQHWLVMHRKPTKALTYQTWEI